ncbi:MAG: hypothetical protein JWR47_2897, partial [Phenylobacterium sp.]|nr:hypothetical protein [Phenylobacterium sp.]
EASHIRLQIDRLTADVAARAVR